MLADFGGKRALLLQGPNGPFFRRLADDLESVGATVIKINFNAADQLFFPGGRSFRGRFEEWPAFLEQLIEEEAPDCAFLFGDCRPYHRAARAVLEARGLESFVVEEGYLRPDHVTIEPGGVNTMSRMPREESAYEVDVPEGEPIVVVKNSFAWSVLYTILNSLCITLLGFLYPHYRHHRDVNTWRQAALWARGFWRRFRHARPERAVLERLSGPLSGRYFLAALQVHNDYQVSTSRFGDVGEFIDEVARSFARSARPEDSLVFKHHPADRAYRDYGETIRKLAEETGLGQRLLYVHDPHLPTLLKHAKGTVVINSTIAFSSLFRRTPVLALGVAVYEWMGLTARSSLDEFWLDPGVVDFERFRRVRNWLLHHNQANGSVWVKLPGAGPSGFFWPPGLRPRLLATTAPELGSLSGARASLGSCPPPRPALASSPPSDRFS
jgi:capsule polysaccharide modification protein KpsS